MIFVFCLLMGLAVSLVSVFIGLGGGVLLVPLLPTVFGLSVHEAVATSLLTIAFVVTEHSYRFNQLRLISWPVVALMGPVSALTAVLAALLSQSVDSQWILKALLVLLALVAMRTLLASFFSKSYQAKAKFKWKDRLLMVSGGGLAGLTSGFAGVGSGVILSPVMISLRAVDPLKLVPTANANMMCTTVAASLSFVASGESVRWNQWGLLRWDLALLIFLSSSLFSRYLRAHQNKLPFTIKTLLLALLLILLMLKIVWQLDAKL